MLSSTQPCANHRCKKTSRALCNCCRLYLCLDHLKEHEDKINGQLPILADEVNILADRFQRMMVQQPSIYLHELKQWRNDAYRAVEEFYKKKLEEYQRLADDRRIEQISQLEKIQFTLRHRLEAGEATKDIVDNLKIDIQSFKEKLNRNRDLRLRLRSLVIDENLIQPLEQSLSESHRTIIRNAGSWSPIAAYDNHFCAHLAPNLCILDHRGLLVTERPWNLGLIADMCWSSALNRFLIITEKTISSFGMHSSGIERCHTSRNGNQRWNCVTCSSRKLYLSTRGWGAHIYEYTFLPFIHFIKRWSSPSICTDDEGIDDLKYKQGNIAIIINCHLNRIRLELRSSSTFDCLWTHHFESITRVYNPSCCPIDDNQWMVIDGDNDELLFINNDGKVSNRMLCEGSPRYAAQLNQFIIVVSTTHEIRLHEI